jgi:two-component system, NarL family, response regulator LiaR
MIRVLLVDDHVALHEDLKSHLQRRDTVQVIAIAPDGHSGVRMALEHHPDVVVMDLMLQAALSGIEATRLILAEWPSCRVVAFTGSRDVRVMQEARCAGMVGFVRKATRDDLIDVIEAAARGERCFPSDLPLAEAAPVGRSTLTAREWEVLRYVAGGFEIKDVAFQLHLTPEGVRYHLHQIKQRLGITSDVELIKFAIQVGVAVLDS